MPIFEEIKDASGRGVSHVIKAKAQIMMNDVTAARLSLKRGLEMFELGNDVSGTCLYVPP